MMIINNIKKGFRSSLLSLITLCFLACSGYNTIELGEGDFLPDIEVTSALPLSLSSVQVLYNQNMNAETLNKANYAIVDNTGVNLTITNLVTIDESNSIIQLTTDVQAATKTYTLQIQNVGSVSGQVIPEAGLSQSFSGYTIDLSGADINVMQGSVFLTNGGLYKYGDIETNSTAAVVTLTIQNTGAKELQFGNPKMKITGTNAGEFFITESLPEKIVAGGSETIDITFSSATLGEKSAVLEIYSNDIDEATYKIAILANAKDLSAPATGNGGALTISNLLKTSFSVHWASATDTVSAQGDLEYLLYYTSNTFPLSNVAIIEAIATPVGSYQSNITTANITGLTLNTQYYFNVIIKDAAGNKVAYNATGQKTFDVATIIADINTSGNSGPEYLYVFNSKLYFSATDGTNGKELWVFDGSNAPSMVANINSAGDSSPADLVELNSKLYFSATDGSNGRELWVYDGVSAPSMITPEINGSGDANPGSLAVFNSKLYFSATDGSNGLELWVYDGVSVAMVTPQINSSADASPASLLVYNSKLYFSATDGSNGNELWVYDGIVAPSMVSDINTGGDSNPTGLKLFNSKLYFQADNGTAGRELHNYDGTTLSFTDFRVGAPSGYFVGFDSMAILGSDMYSFGVAPPVTMIKHDGTTSMAVTTSACDSLLQNLFTFGSKVYYSGRLSGSDFELCSFDGSNDAAEMDINPSPGDSSNPKNFIEFNSQLYFQADDGTNGTELWRLN